jgi:hypothetical protein
LCNVLDHSQGRFGRLGQESAQEAHGYQLQRKTQTIPLTAQLPDDRPVPVIQVKISSELLGRRIFVVSTIPRLLRLADEVDRHRGVFSENERPMMAQRSVSVPQCPYLGENTEVHDWIIVHRLLRP